jgi:hypothetical protein
LGAAYRLFGLTNATFVPGKLVAVHGIGMLGKFCPASQVSPLLHRSAAPDNALRSNGCDRAGDWLERIH